MSNKGRVQQKQFSTDEVIIDSEIGYVLVTKHHNLFKNTVKDQLVWRDENNDDLLITPLDGREPIELNEAIGVMRKAVDNLALTKENAKQLHDKKNKLARDYLVEIKGSDENIDVGLVLMRECDVREAKVKVYIKTDYEYWNQVPSASINLLDFIAFCSGR